MADNTELLIQTLIDLMTTPPQNRGLGQGPCKKPVGNGSIEIAIAQNDNGWQFHDRAANEWAMYPHECIEATLINYDIRTDVKISDEDKAKFDKQIRNLQEDIALLQNNPERLKDKQDELQKVYNDVDDKSHYIYVYLRDRKQSYSIRCRPHNNFVRSLFGTLNTILKKKKSALLNPIKLAPLRQAVTGKPTEKVIFSNLWIDDLLQYSKKEDQFEKSDWVLNWKTHVDQIGGEIRKLHKQGKPYFGVSTALPPSSDYQDQAALPPSKTPEEKFTDLQESVNKAFNESDTGTLAKILSSLNDNPKAIASLGGFIDQAKEYVLQTQKALQSDDVIDVESTAVVEAVVEADAIADNPANPKSTVKDDEEF